MGLLLKIAIFAVVAYGVWTTARRWLGILGGREAKAPPPARHEAAAQQPRGPGRGPVIEETRLCAACGAYVSTSAVKCGRADCPQPA